MKRKFIILTLLFFTTIAYSQVAYWSVHPRYSKIKILGNGNYLVSKDGKFGMLDSSEKEIIPLVYDSISNFTNHFALLFKDKRFVAYANEKGIVTDISTENYVVDNNSIFRDDHLLVKNDVGYFYINGETHEKKGPFSYAFPFSEGFARVGIPKSRKHILDGGCFHKYLSKQDEIVELPIEDASPDEKNYIVDFLSSVSNGKSIVVIKKRVFEYNVQANSLTPLSFDGSQNKKSRIYTKDRPVEIKAEMNNRNSIQLQKGYMDFDPEMRLLQIISHGANVRKNDILPEMERQIDSSLKSASFPDTKLLGLLYMGSLILPAQFENVQALRDDEAVVKFEGMYGVVKIAGQDQCQFVLNDNIDVGFEHKNTKANIKVVCPPYMNPSLITLISDDDNFQINADTRRENRNVESSSLMYQSIVNIPEDIDLNLSPSSITVKMFYDGLKFVSKKISFNSWYINNFSVDIIRHPIQNSVLNLDVIVRNSSLDSKNYFKNVYIETEDSVISTITKVTEELYNAKLYGWKNGIAKFDINIMEDGCPIITYPFRFDVKNSAEIKLEKEEQPKVATKKRNRSTLTKKPTKETKKIYIPN